MKKSRTLKKLRLTTRKMNRHITLQAEGEFPFVFYIEKAVPKEEDGLLIVEGVASTLNVDHDNERMAESALISMANVINKDTVPLRLEHNQDESAVIGSVYRAWVDDRNQLWIRAAIDPNHPAGPVLHDSLKQGSKFGLSVGGKVRRAVRELVESTGNMVKTFYDVALDEVSVTRKPANYDAWLFAKSIKSKEDDVTPFYNSPIYKQFLFENQQLDYVAQFAKSVPDKAWKKIKSEEGNNNNMEDKEKKDETTKSEEQDKKEEEGTEKSFVSKSEFTKFADQVAKGFKELAGLMKEMSDTAKDTTNPDKDKPEEETQQTAKAREGQEDEGENGGEEKKEGDEKAKDATNPDKDKPEEETQQTAKSEEKEEDKKEEKKQKSEDSEEKDEEETKEKSEKEKEEEGEDAMKSISDAIASIVSVSKHSEGDKVTKSKGVHSLDKFAVVVAEAINSLDERLEKSGTRVPGLTERIVDVIRNDKSIQDALVGMIREPGFKKSMSMGMPYMVTKDGKKFALMAKPVGADENVAKSMEGKSFKDVYKTSFSSIKEDQQ